MGHPTPYWYGYVGGRGIVGCGVIGVGNGMNRWIANYQPDQISGPPHIDGSTALNRDLSFPT